MNTSIQLLTMYNFSSIDNLIIKKRSLQCHSNVANYFFFYIIEYPPLVIPGIGNILVHHSFGKSC